MSLIESLESRVLFTAGTLDPTFGAGGLVTTSFAPDSASAHAIVVQSDGRPVVAAQIGNNFGLVRYNSAGAVDSSFGVFAAPGLGTPGNTVTNARVNALTIQPDGRIVAVGSLLNTGQLTIARFNTNGALDTSFANAGQFTPGIFSGSGQANAVAVDSAGRIVVAGQTRDVPSGNFRFTVLRLTPAGQFDPSFGAAGVANAFLNSLDATANSLAIQPNDEIVVAGAALLSGQSNIAVARFTTAGVLDPGFGSAGQAALAGNSVFNVTLARYGTGLPVGSFTTSSGPPFFGFSPGSNIIFTTGNGLSATSGFLAISPIQPSVFFSDNPARNFVTSSPPFALTTPMLALTTPTDPIPIGTFSSQLNDVIFF